MEAQKIAELQSQIEMVKERLERNKRALLDNKGTTERVANMEYKKINSSDPSMIWRWNEGQKDMKEANERISIGTANKYNNEVKALLKNSIPTNYAEQVQLFDRVSSKIAEGETLGLDVSALEEMERIIAKKVDASRGNQETVKKIRSLIDNLDLQLQNGTINQEKYIAELEVLKIQDFDDHELRLELESKISLGKKKIEDIKNQEMIQYVTTKLKDLDARLRDRTISNAEYSKGIKELLSQNFDDDELRLELERKSKLGEKKISSGKKAQAIIERDKTILDKINKYRKEKLKRAELDKLPGNWKNYEKMPDWPYGPLE